MTKRFSRRTFIAGAAATSTAVGAQTFMASAARANTPIAEQTDADSAGPLGVHTVPFDGPHQAGIALPQQGFLQLIGLNFVDGIDKEHIRRALTVWTEAARELTQGRAPLAELEPEMVSTPANLTTTIGFGQGFFDKADLADEAPLWLADGLPAFATDNLQPEWGQTDLVLQVCGDDPVSLSHAARYLLKIGRMYAEPVWVQHGFIHSHGAKKEGETPRNLFGFKDGTVNPRTPEELDDVVWIDKGPKKHHNGTCMVVRRIEMLMDKWDILDRHTRTIVMGREIESGAPAGGEKEGEPVNLDKTDETGLPVIDPNSHVALAHPPKQRPHQQLLRRSYNYDLPPTKPGKLTDTGLVFICFQQDPNQQFVPIQRRLADNDRFNEWIDHIGSAMYFIPRGTDDEKDYWGSEFFD